MRRVNWAIFGTGAVAHKVCHAIQQTPGASVALVVSRSHDRAAAFAAQHGVAGAMAGYEAAAETAGIDAVYIATPPSEHGAHALACIRGGKAVLIEKPFAASAAEGEAIVEAARARGVFCMEAMWTRFLPAVILARRLIAQGAIGEPQSLHATFANAQIVDPDSTHFQPALGGGALNHRGVYPISLALHLLGPAVLAGASVRTGATGVDESVSAVLEHGGGAASTLFAGLTTTTANDLAVFGSSGRLAFQGPIFRPHGVEIIPIRPRPAAVGGWGLKARMQEGDLAQGLRRALDRPLSLIRRRRRRSLNAPFAGNGYGHQVVAVMDALSRGETEHPLMPLDESLAVLRLMDDIRAGARTGPAGDPSIS